MNSMVEAGLLPAGSVDAATVPVAGIARVCRRFADEVRTERLLQGTGLTPAQLEQADLRIDAASEQLFVDNLLAARPGIDTGLIAGTCYRPGVFGVLGTAAASCDTAADALAMFLRYSELTGSSFRPVLHEDGRQWVSIAFGAPATPTGARYFIDREIACAVTLVRDTVGIGRSTAELAAGLCVHSSSRDPGWAAACRRVLGVESGSGRDEVHIHRRLLETPLPLANAALRQQLEQQCRQQLLLQRRQPPSVLAHVAQVLAGMSGRVPAVDEVARALSMSERTLRRRLAAEGTGFQALVDGWREARARELLASSQEGVDHIAQHLGYSEASAFIHAFKRWTGFTPGRFRDYCC